MASTIISGITFGICALIMFAIGFSQLKSKNPVGFYSGETGPKREQLTDMEAWNKKHGTMWIIYGFIIVAAWIAGLFCNGSALILIPYMGGLLIPVIFMIGYHNKLIKMYYIK